jgi:hypothetical protein
MVKSSIIDLYLENEKKLMLLFKNNIAQKNWPNLCYTEHQLKTHKGNIAWCLGNKDLVVDIDPRNNGDISFKKLCKDLNIKLKPYLKTPRGGSHIYLKLPDLHKDLKYKKTLKEYPGIDFLKKGNYCLIATCEKEEGKYELEDNILEEFNQTICPDALLDILISHKNKSKSEYIDEDLGDFSDLIINDQSWPKQKVIDTISKLDPSMNYDDWVKVGMALHNWNIVEGLEIWEDWSKKGDNYNEGDTEKQWGYFDANGGITLGTISYMSKEVDFDQIEKEINAYIKRIKKSSEKEIQMDICCELKKKEFSNINKEKIVKAIQDRYKTLSGVRLSVSDIRTMISGVEVVNGEFIVEGETPKWCKDWVYINSHGSFANLENLRLYKSESFNIKNGRHIPKGDGGSKQTAVKYIADNGFIESVDSIAYLPNIEDKIVYLDNCRLLNSFNKKTVPIESSHFSQQGKLVIEMVKRHIKLICYSNENCGILTQWLAHQVQHPGKKILWAPVIQSIEGVGKSFFGELLRVALGDRNVGTVSPTQVTSDFNGWATNVCVNVLEEIRIKGKNRYEAVNSLKPLITDRIIQINDKGIKQFMSYNTTNYICFSNFKDCIPLSKNDRRWWVVFAPIDTLDDISLIVGEDISEYFPKLFNLIREYGREIRKWLLEYTISEEFMKIKQAPMTNEKLCMIATEESGLEGLDEISDVIENGGKFFNKDIISSSDLFDKTSIEYPLLDLNNKQKNIILKHLGYSKQPKLVKIGGEPKRIWSKKPYSNEEIRKYLDKN